ARAALPRVCVVLRVHRLQLGPGRLLGDHRRRGGSGGLDADDVSAALAQTLDRFWPHASYSLARAKVDDTSALWQEYRRSQDRAVRDRLILTYAPLVKFVAGRLGSGPPAHLQEGGAVPHGLSRTS